MSKAVRTLGKQLEHQRLDLKEQIAFLSLQVRIWRSLAIIFAHHPSEARGKFGYMALAGTYAGDETKLYDHEKIWTERAKRCGRSMGIFSDDGEKCPDAPI